MDSEQKRKKLVQLLDERVFDPILRAPERRFPEGQRERLLQIKRNIGGERHRYMETYRTPEEVRRNYLSDLASTAGQRTGNELRQLGLPTLADVKADFLRLCDDLGVSPRGSK